MRVARRLLHRRRRSRFLSLLVAASLLLAALAAGAAQAETPAQRIARLRAQAAKVQATIDRMNDRIEVLVERYNANQEALERTVERGRQTKRQLAQARRQLADAQRVLDERMRSIYINGPVTGLEQLLEARTLNDAVVITRYQQSATESDTQAIASVKTSRAKLTGAAAALRAQQREQEGIRGQLAEQRRFLDRLDADVKQAVEQERQRQEELRRQALARKLAAERAAREKAAQEAAAQEAAAQQAAAQQEAQQSAPAPSGSSGASAAAEQAIAFARAQIGEPYMWGGTGPDAWDCSGLTMMAYRSAGIFLPRTSADQWTVGQHIHDMVDLEPGDLVFYASDLSDSSTIHHVGLYIGDGLMIEAPHTGEYVRTAAINRSDYFGGTRVTG